MTKDINMSRVSEETQHWLKEFVVALDLCPFARFPLEAEQVHFVVSQAQDTEHLTQDLLEAIEALKDDREIETTLLIHPGVLNDFEEYLDYVATAEAIMAHLNYEGVFQIASFHPDYCFEGEAEDDPANFTNRSPYPMLHLLRETSLTKAIDSYEDIEAVPERNISKLRELGVIGIRNILNNPKS